MVAIPRQLHTQQVHYLRKKVNYNDSNIGSGVLVGTLPAGSIIDYASNLKVTTAFNAGTTNVLTVGTTAGGSDISANGTSLAGATGTKRMSDADTLGPLAVDTDIFVTYTQTGGAATAGVAYIVLKFIPNNDL